MKLTNINEDSVVTGCFLAYSRPGVGKTHAIGTLPITKDRPKVAAITPEPRDARRVLKFFKGTKDIDLYSPEYNTESPQDYYEEILELLFKWEQEAKAGTLPYNSISYDGMSYQMTAIKDIVEEAQHQVSDFKTDSERVIFMIGGKKEKDTGYVLWNAVGGAMIRICTRLNALSKHGIYVYANAHLDDSVIPWRPFFQGGMFPKAYTGIFDFIGLVLPRKEITNSKGERLLKGDYPPAIFLTDINMEIEFESKCCDTDLLAAIQTRIKAGKQQGPYLPFDFEKIVSIMNKVKSDNSK